jgi:hypothetical protein
MGNQGHNKTHHPLYNVWINMRRRCDDSSAISYKYYGGRGIAVCEEWSNFDSFLAWALSNGYRQGLSLDRIDGDGNYCPENCRWADWKTQANNKRNNRRITINGVTKNAKEWADGAGIKWSTFQRRIDVYGFTPEEALSCPVKSHENHFKDGVTVNGTTKSLEEWGREYGIAGDRIARRLLAGWDPEKAVSAPAKTTGSWVKKTIAAGTRFGTLTIVGEADPMITRSGRVLSRYKCVCDCGCERLVIKHKLTRPHPIRSCGKNACQRQARKMLST